MKKPRDPESTRREAVIMAASTTQAGWTRDTLNQWGVPWPPPPGWKETLIQHGFPYRPDKNGRAVKRCERTE